MKNDQINRVMESAREVYITELDVRTSELESFINACGEFTEADINRLERFFHSMSGTAATLGLDYLSSIGREWENKLRTRNGPVTIGDSTIVDCMLSAVKDIKRNISDMHIQREATRKSNGEGRYGHTARGKILLVDDDISILKLLENAFTIEGYEVYICDDPVTAMDMISVTMPDIILLDVMMPDISGFELLGQIRSKEEYSDIHIVILSAKGDIDDKILGIKSGADDYIVKPFAIGEVTTRVEMIMRRSKNYREKLMKDHVTGACSRYYFNLRISEEFERYKRYGSIFSIVFLDIDNYKHINDNYGHHTGEYVLRKYISSMIASMRGCDSIYRYGCGEFIILMPDTPEEQAYLAIERIRGELEGGTISAGGEDFYITFSAGINQAGDKSESVEKLISDADKAMYFAKKRGRDKTVIYSDKIDDMLIKKTLLVVDDENTILKLLTERLACIGYNVAAARDGNHAVALASEIRPDAVVLDLNLPDIDGFEVCRRIKEGAGAYPVKVIILLKKEEKEHIEKCLRSEADDYVTKPFSMAKLEERIKEILHD